MRTRVALVVTVLFVLIAALAGCGGKEGRTVAIVNGEPVSRTELYHVLERDYGHNGLLTAILEKAVREDAKKQSITVSDTEVQKMMDRDIKELGGKEQFQEALKSRRVTEQDYRDRVGLTLLLEKLLTKGVTVSDAEVKEYFERNRAMLDKPAQVKLHRIVTDSQQKADEAYKKLMGGSDFASVAREFSSDVSTKGTGGDAGWVARNRISPAELANTVAALQVGQIGKPVRIGQQFYIVRVDDQKEAKPAVFDEIKNDIRRDLALRKGEEFNAYQQRLLAASDVEILWPRYKYIETELRGLKGPSTVPLEVGPAPAAQQGGKAAQPPKPRAKGGKR